MSGAGTLSIRTDGCLGEQPAVSGSMSIGRLSIGVSDGETTRCLSGYLERGGFRISEVPDTSRWRIDALP